ncbi:zinc-binding dehydrogenase [Rudanella paleaurantiibacter]|uniref:Zinc-binding dehydrogenase n=1 Tax=Rudanella paleaurantiibacter TaxID=2614655 RepID=A0A7J5TV83_9BACT|nr:NAD(P)-dependent alcohol dehydrogenase [Rudanella paleaurantiibacter]KAB7728068.1 zinc-binding dehydrogenase [Rudanella paleaurantiibacter]
MKAVMYRTYGPPSVLHVSELEKPVPKPNEILVRVHASTVTSGTVWLRRGAFPGSRLMTGMLRLIAGIFRPRRPVLGVEFSGVVEATGNRVTKFHPGDAVYGTTTGLQQGSYAEYLCVPESWRGGVVALKPSRLTFAEAAALPVGGMTALTLLNRAGNLNGRTVLVYGASGSVGTYAVQLATYHGASVTAVCSTTNMALVRSLGADEVLDYTQTDLTRLGRRFDVVIDAVGKLPASSRNALLRPGGRFVSVMSMTGETNQQLERLHQLVEEGRLKPVIDRIYPLDQIVAAHDYVDSGRKKGNVVVDLVTAGRKQLTSALLAFGLFIVAIGCSPTHMRLKSEQPDNPVLEKLYRQDVAIRKLDAETDTVNLERYDKVHRERVFTLLAENAVITPLDKLRAAWILQHTAAQLCEGTLTSISPENFLLAYKLSSSGLHDLVQQQDTATIRTYNVARVVALNYDRYLLYTTGYQKFGTQFVFDDKTGEMWLAPIDTTLATDEERKTYQVAPLQQLRATYKIKPK